jgi:hypothetical protein
MVEQYVDKFSVTNVVLNGAGGIAQKFIPRW